MSLLFEPTSIGGLRLPNRFIRSATWDGLADEAGRVKPGMVKLLADLAQGGVGLIITGHAYVTRRGQAGPWQLGAFDDALLPGLTDLVQGVHAAGGRVCLQIAHAGLMAPPELTGQLPQGPSAAPPGLEIEGEELSRAEIAEIVQAFGLAAARAQTAGFDAVQIHAAHGYLLSQFLSPAFNQRQDDYGGPPTNRARAAVEAAQEIRRAVGPDFPVLVKMNCQDFLDNGLTLADSVAAAKLLVQAGVNAVEVSGGTGRSGKLSPVRQGIKTVDLEAYFRHEAKAFKAALGAPVSLVGGIRSLEKAEELVSQGWTDLVSLARPLIREPNLIRRWQAGDRRRAGCVSDNRCYVSTRSGQGIACPHLRERGQS